MRKALRHALVEERNGGKPRITYFGINYNTEMALWHRGLVDIDNFLTQKGRDISAELGISAAEGEP